MSNKTRNESVAKRLIAGSMRDARRDRMDNERGNEKFAAKSFFIGDVIRYHVRDDKRTYTNSLWIGEICFRDFRLQI